MNGFVGDWSLSNDAVYRVEWLFQAKPSVCLTSQSGQRLSQLLVVNGKNV